MTVPSPTEGVQTVDVLFKLGGSLLEWAGLPEALDRILGNRGPRPTAIVVGGGASADAVRRWDETHDLGAASAHALAIAAMDFNARMIREMLRRRGRDVVTRREDLRIGATLIPDTEAELLYAGDDVPSPSWEVTSDSLAAWLARRLGSRQLVLVKSIDPPEDRRLVTAMKRQLVDSRFIEFAQGFEVSWINLRGGAILPFVPMVP